MFSIKTARKPRRKATGQGGYEQHRDKMARVSAEKSRKGRDVADDRPDCANPERRAQSRSLEYFLRTYLPQTFYLPWSPDHRTVIQKLESIMQDGGQSAYAMPRGSGKTAIVEGAVLFATLHGLRRFVSVIGSEESAAVEILKSIKTELETNDLLDEDFHFTCGPIRALEGIANRCSGQLWKGKRTRIVWTDKRIVLPTVEGSLSSGIVLDVAGITGRIRGKKAKLANGQSIRPDLALLDDPQTDESAHSPSQVAQRERLVTGAVLGLAGPGKKIAAVMPCTVIATDDLADRVLNRKKHPEWQGERAKLMNAMPTNVVLWDQYAQIRADSLRADNKGREATEFYAANREQMDAGALPAWPARHNPDEISAIQHAMNLRIDHGEAVYAAEYQNEPLIEQLGEQQLSADEICAKVNNLDRRAVPIGCETLTAFIDVQGSVLFWMVIAWAEGFTGYIIDYGTFPEQHGDYFTLNDLRVTLAKVFPAGGEEAQIYAGLEKLTDQLISRAWIRNGTEMRISKLLIDAGYKTDTVYQFCRQSKHAAIVMPSHGRSVDASSIPWEHFKAAAGEKIGHHWLTKPNERGVRHITIDTNFWKTFFHARLRVAMGDKSCLSLFGKVPKSHRMLADHFTAEYGVKTEGRGRTVIVFKLRPGRDNHLLDCAVGNCAAASLLGVKLDTDKPVRKPAPRRGKRVTPLNW